MKKTEMVFILDRSGSMASLRSDVVDSINTLIEEQKKLPGEATFTLVVFNDTIEKIIDNVPIQDVKILNDSDFKPSGMTAMNDAICITIDEVGDRLAKMPESERPEKVSVAILTDGEENFSTKFTLEDVQQRVYHQKDVYSWDFIYLGANQDAILSGSKMGLNKNQSHNYIADPKGIRLATQSVSMAYTRSRSV